MCAGAMAPRISVALLTSKSISISWTLPEFSLQSVQYNISLSRQTIENSQTLCPTVEDSRNFLTTTNSTSFTDLEEFSSYRVTVTAVYDAFGVTRMASSNEGFTTLSAGRST